MEACPTDNKEKAMSLLHSFYCRRHVGVVLFSTLFFRMFNISYWKILALAGALIPLINVFLFAKVSIASLIEEGRTGLKIKELFFQKDILGISSDDGLFRRAYSRRACFQLFRERAENRNSGDDYFPDSFALGHFCE